MFRFFVFILSLTCFGFNTLADTEWDKYKDISKHYYFLNAQKFTLLTCGISNELLEKTFNMTKKVMVGKKDKVQIVNNYNTHKLIYNPDTNLQIIPPQLFFKLIADKEKITELDKKLVDLMNQNAQLLISTTSGVIKDTFAFLVQPNKAEVNDLKVVNTKNQTLVSYGYRGNLVTERIEDNMKYIALEDIYSRVVLRHEIAFEEDAQSNKLYPKRIVTKYDASGRVPIMITTLDYQSVRLMTNNFIFPEKISAGLEDQDPMMTFTFNHCFGM